MTRAWLIGCAAFLGLLAAIALAAALLGGESAFDQGAPEAAVQQLLRAAEDDDYRGAYDLLSDELKEECTFQEFASREIWQRTLRDDRVGLKRTRVEGDDAYVTVRVTSFHRGDLFGSHESSYERRFSLRLEGGRWLFSDYPWPFPACERSPGLGPKSTT